MDMKINITSSRLGETVPVPSINIISMRSVYIHDYPFAYQSLVFHSLDFSVEAARYLSGGVREVLEVSFEKWGMGVRWLEGYGWSVSLLRVVLFQPGDL